MANFGSFQNLVAGTNPALVPAVGMGVTHCSWSDRDPFTIVEVLSPRKLVVQSDNYERTDNNGMSESQAYTFTPNPEGHKVTITLSKNGQWIREGESIKATKYILGRRDRYHDYSF